MFYRVTQSQMAATARMHFAQQTSELGKVQQQISSGLRIQRPADDPAGTRRSLIQRDRVERLEAHETSIQHVKSRLSQAHVQLRDASDALTRAREIALQAPQITDENEANVLVTELNGLLSQLDSIANSSDESGYLFSGTAASVKPFPESATFGGKQTYAGTTAMTQLYVAGDVNRQALLPGDLVFQHVSRESSVILGRTGTRIGTGTDTATGLRQLQISHALTTYSGGSGISAGSNSAAGDTIIGPAGAHMLQINDTSGTGASGTISLNGGNPVAFTSADTNLEVEGPDGSRVFVNTTSIAAGFNGSVSITADGAMSIDGGQTSVPLTFSANQVLTDSRDGSVVNLDTTATIRTGTDELDFPGTSDIFNTVRNLRDDILNTRNLESSARIQSLNRRLADVERIQNHVLDVVGIQSVSMEQIDRLEARTGDLKLAEKIEYSDTTSADLSQAVLRLQELNNLQQFTMAAVGQLLTPNLLNYIQ